MRDVIYRDDVVKEFIKLFGCIQDVSDIDEWADICQTTANEISSDDTMEIRNLLLFKEYMRGRRDAEVAQGDGRDNIKRYPNCQMRTSLGNCDAIGGFCTSINAPICDAFHKSVDATQDWIPISDGLSSDGDNVFVTVIDDHGDRPWRYTDIAWLCNGTWISNNEVLFGDVIAWMPQPKPYKGGGDE